MYVVRKIAILVLALGVGPAAPLLCGTAESAPEREPAALEQEIELIMTQDLEEFENLLSGQHYFPDLLALMEDDKTEKAPPLPPVPSVNPPSPDRQKHEERIALFRLWRIMNDIDLTDEQVDKFFPLMRKMQQKEKELAEARQALMKSLREEVDKEKPAETVLKQLMEQIKDNGHQSWLEKKNSLDQVAQFLTPGQQARLVLSLNRVEKDIWETVARVRSMPRMERNLGESFRTDMEKVRKNLEKFKQELREKGYPVSEENDKGPVQKDKPGSKK